MHNQIIFNFVIITTLIHQNQSPMETSDYNQIFRERTKKLALNIITITSEIKYTDALVVLRKQLIRSVTSVAANYRAVCRSRSLKEKYSKLCIVVEECDESQFWLELLFESKYIDNNNYNILHHECSEILKVMATYRKKVGVQINC